MSAVLAMLLVFARQPAPSCAVRDLPPQAAVEFLGAFTNMRYTGEHAYGYSLHLWRSGRCVFGLFMASDGLAGDSPAGMLESVRYVRSTGSLDFRARLTEGRFSNRDIHDVPSRDSYRFSGALDRRGVRGTLIHANALTPAARAVARSVFLRRSPAEAETAIRAATTLEWQRQADDVLRRRGPQW